MRIFRTFKEARIVFFHDKWILAAALCPIAIGATLYYFLSRWAYSYVLEWVNELPMHVSMPTWLSGPVETFLLILFWIIALLVVGLTFSLVVAVLAAPFNDFIAGRTFCALAKLENSDIKALEGEPRNIFWIFFNEIKKTLILLVFLIFIALLGFFPPLLLFSYLLALLALSAEFLSYSWSRKNHSWLLCFKDLFANAANYLISGFIFSFLLATPVVNFIAIPYGVVYFTLLNHRQVRPLTDPLKKA
jgi:uncharacterized protein involved in cysteine biosynthesis